MILLGNGFKKKALYSWLDSTDLFLLLTRFNELGLGLNSESHLNIYDGALNIIKSESNVLVSFKSIFLLFIYFFFFYYFIVNYKPNSTLYFILYKRLLKMMV